MKSKFLVFCFSFLPGAGQMYQGYMKRGLSLMLMFFGVCVASAVVLDVLVIFTVVIWAYSFFDTFNLARMTDDEKASNPDHLFFNIEKLTKEEFKTVYEKRHRWIGLGAIVLGVLMLYNTFVAPLLWQIYYAYEMKWLAQILNGVPNLVIALALVFIGYKMLKSYGKQTEQQEDIIEYKEVK